ncbi:MAG TPA: hypothetical protein VMF52_18655 [Steroidobacteraceae bacterium]|nr:hypothetical protein [Steroidobacteraceae bacterium]
MTQHGASRPREDGRHWLPSQGVDPAPLTELNAECLGLLAARAADRPDRSTPPLLVVLGREWSALHAPAVRRLAAAPYSLFDLGFARAPRWLETRARGVSDEAPRTAERFFEPDIARSITRRMLVYAWHLARSRPRAACLVFGSTIQSVEALAACSLSTLEAAAENNAESLRPRWTQHIPFWRELLSVASAGTDTRLRELMLGGIQRLAAETLAAHCP